MDMVDGTMLEVKEIDKRYERMQVLKEVSLDAAEGTIVGVIGPNGCGKSTLLSIVAGTLKPDKGTVRLILDGKSYVRREYASLVGYVPQTNPLLEQLSVRDNLRFWCKNRQLCDQMMRDYSLYDIRRKRVGKLSGGMKRRLAIACALANAPKLLVMDEPTAALDIYYKKMVHEEMLRYRDKGGIILLATHEQEEIQMCDKIFEF